MNNLIWPNYNKDYINSWIKNNQAIFNKNTFKNELVAFNNEYSKKQNFFVVINEYRNAPIEIVNRVLNKENEIRYVIGTGLKKYFILIRLLKLDDKHWN